MATGINLTATTHALEMITSTAQTVHCQVSATEITSSTTIEVSNQTTVSSATTTTILAAPAASTQRVVHSITASNQGASANAITIQKDVGGTNFIIFGPVTLEAGERVEFTQDRGFRVFDATGREKNQAAVRTINVSAGASSVALGSLTFSNGNGVSFGLSTGASAGTITASVSSLSFSNANGVTFGVAGSTLTASVAAPTLSLFNNFVPEATIQTAFPATNCFWVFPLAPQGPFPGNMTVGTLKLIQSNTVSTASSTNNSQSFSSNVRVGLYSLVNSTQLTLINSASLSFSRSANTSNFNFMSGRRFLTFGTGAWSSNPVLSNGVQYWLGVVLSSAGSNFSGSLAVVNAGGISNMGGDFGINGTTCRAMPFWGSVATASPPNSINNTQIANGNTNQLSYPTVIMMTNISAG